MATKKSRSRRGPKGPGPKEIKGRLEEYVRRVSSPKDRPYFTTMISELVKNNAIPLDLFEWIPSPPAQVGKTRFDQLYDAAMSLAFPGYMEGTLGKLLGPTAQDKPKTKIWRAMFPEKFRLSHVLLRASSFQEAFALGCDYACRVSLRTNQVIPSDMTVRIQFMSEKAVRRMLEMRWANRAKKRKQLQLVGREYTPKELAGARLIALGDPENPDYSVAKYAEVRDLRKILRSQGRVRISSVETETFRPKDDGVEPSL